MKLRFKWGWSVLVVSSVLSVGLSTSTLSADSTQQLNATTHQNQVIEKRYGPVKSGETLWNIASKVRIDGMTRLQMMKLLHKHNPQSFVKGNINRIKKGTYLTIPGTTVGQSETLISQQVLDQQAKMILAGQATQSKQTIPTSLPVQGPFMPNQVGRIAQLQQELGQVTSELNLTRDTLKGLQQQNVHLQQTYSLERQKFQQDLQLAQTQLAESQKNHLNLQNELGLVTQQKKMAESNHMQVLATVKALNSDIGTLKERVIELEALQKLKDAHITELKKALDHASSVIKEQTAVNLQIHQRMNELEAKLSDVIGVAATPKPTLRVLGSSGDSIIAAQQIVPAAPSATQFANAAPATAALVEKPHRLTPLDADETSSLSQLLEDGESVISPKFWAILILAILMFILAYFWRSLSGMKPKF